MTDKHSDKYTDIFDHYVHSLEPRRTFLKKLAQAAGGTAAAMALLPWLEGTGAEAAMVAPGDSRITTGPNKASNPDRALDGSGRLCSSRLLHRLGQEEFGEHAGNDSGVVGDNRQDRSRRRELVVLETGRARFGIF